MSTEYQNAAQCRAAGVEPVPQVGDEFMWSQYRFEAYTAHAGDMEFIPWDECDLMRRGDVTIPEHSDTPEGK